MSDQKIISRPRAGKKWITCGSLSILFLLLNAHFYGLLPTSRLGPRSFVVSRDYGDMERIFETDHLPPSFKIKEVDHPFGRGMMDGPPPVLYHATVAGSDYTDLIKPLLLRKTKYGDNHRMDLAVRKFNNRLAITALELNWMTPEERRNEEQKHSKRFIIPDFYAQETIIDGGYMRYSYIVADINTSDTIPLYITTWLPYDE